MKRVFDSSIMTEVASVRSRVSKGFDFLGYSFGTNGIICLATRTIVNFLERMVKLYEQGATDQRIHMYVRR